MERIGPKTASSQCRPPLRPLARSPRLHVRRGCTLPAGGALPAAGGALPAGGTLPAKARRMAVIRVRHVTTYRYAQPVAFGEHRLMLTPRDAFDQRTVVASVAIEPRPFRTLRNDDRYANRVDLVEFDAFASRLSFASEFTVETTPSALPSPKALRGNALSPSERDAAAAFASASVEGGHDLARFIDLHRRGPEDAPSAAFEVLSAITREATDRFRYRARHAPGVQSAAETLSRGAGTCRDFAVLLMAAARALGLPACFVSGYVVTRRGGAGVARRGGGSTHGWAQVLIPGHGWLDFDPTNAIVGSRDLVRVSLTRDAAEAVPLGGTYLGLGADCLGMDVWVETIAEPDHSTLTMKELAPC